MKVKVAVVQDSPIFFDKDATLKKANEIVGSAASQNCNLIVFPESFIPGYPRGFNFGSTVGNRDQKGRELYSKYHQESIDLESEDLVTLEKMSREHDIYLVIGVTEKERQNGSLYCSMLYISPKNGLLGVHRKIKPTGTERLIWAESDGTTLTTYDTKIGKLGGLICWENYMPLARMAMYSKGIDIYIAPTADSRPEWTITMQQIALEGRCYVVGCNQFFQRSMYPENYKKHLSSQEENICPGGSVFVGPDGKIIKGPLFDQSGILIAELDLDRIQQVKLDFDVNGHYSRPDIFKFEVTGQPEMKHE